jgi:hypothetical protein
MRIQKLFLGSILWMSATLWAAEGQQLSCFFTEPFYDLDVDLVSGKIVRTDFDWEDLDPNSDYIKTVLAETSRVKLSSTGKALKILVSDSLSKKKILEGQLDFSGSNGMSDHKYPVHIIHHSKNRDPMWGGCEIGGLAAYEDWEMDPQMKIFAQYTDAATALCYDRAVADWTKASSASLPGLTKFFVLYSSEEVPGEAGNVSQSFASAERELLFEKLESTRLVAAPGTDPAALKASMWSYCDLYGSLLQKRFLPLEPEASAQ